MGDIVASVYPCVCVCLCLSRKIVLYAEEHVITLL